MDIGIQGQQPGTPLPYIKDGVWHIMDPDSGIIVPQSDPYIDNTIPGFNRRVLFSLAIERAIWAASGTSETQVTDPAEPFVENYSATYPGSERGIPPLIRSSQVGNISKILYSHLMLGVRFDTDDQLVTIREYWGPVMVREIVLNSSHFPVSSLGYAIPMQVFGAYNGVDFSGDSIQIRAHSWSIGSAPGKPGYVTANEGWDNINSSYPTINKNTTYPVKLTVQWSATSDESLIHYDHFEMTT